MNRNWIQFWKLAEPEHLRLRAFCRKLTGNRDDGDDLYQDSLVKALTGYESLRKVEAFRAWLYRITVNEYKNRCRKPWWKMITLTPERSEMSSFDPGSAYAARRRLEIAFRALNSNDHALVTLFELQGWTVAELTEIAGQSEGNIKVRLFRSRKKMRRALIRFDKRSAQEKVTRNNLIKEKVCVVTKPGKD